MHGRWLLWLFPAVALACVDTSGLQSGGPGRDGPPLPDAGVVGDGGTGGADAAALADPFLVAAIPFDEETSAATVGRDVTGNGHDATLLATTRIVPGAGIRGGALVVETDQDGADIPSLANELFPRSGTLSFWFQYTFDPNDGENRGVLDFHSTDREHLFLRRANGATTTFQAAYATGVANPAYTFDAVVVVQPRTWTHVVLTWDETAGIGAFYVGGVLVKRAPYGRKPFAPTKQRVRFGNVFRGSFDEISLWKRPMSSAEVAALP